MADRFPWEAILGLIGAGTQAKAGSPGSLGEAFGVYNKPSTPQKGDALKSIASSLLPILAMGGLGAGIGALVSPGARGKGAQRGLGMGAGMGAMKDIELRTAPKAEIKDDRAGLIKEFEQAKERKLIDPSMGFEQYIRTKNPIMPTGYQRDLEYTKNILRQLGHSEEEINKLLEINAVMNTMGQ